MPEDQKSPEKDQVPPNSFFRAVGGRKNFAGYLAFLALTGMALPLNASFTQYAATILMALGITSGLVAFEDLRRNS